MSYKYLSLKTLIYGDGWSNLESHLYIFSLFNLYMKEI